MTEKSLPVWTKKRGEESLEALNLAYTAGRDVRDVPAADHALALHDLATNAAHAIMLGEAGIAGAEETRSLLGALVSIRERVTSGEIVLDARREDIHMSLEGLVTEIAGPGSGGRLHTGRSRNDQVATDMRLWLRERIADVAAETAVLAETLADHSLAHAKTAIPGMTHMQPAMITTWGHWTAAYLARVTRDLRHFQSVLDECVECPLGSAASFGSSWPTNRERTAELLGFEGPTANTTDTIQSRGELEARFVFAAAQLAGHLSGMGQDLILLSTPPRQWIRLPDEFTTGSSIMPQKRNPDFAEVTRAKASVLAGHVQALLGIGSAAPAGYNRDTQWTKYIVMDAASEIEFGPLVFAHVFRAMTVFDGRMLAGAEGGFLNATDIADYLARSRSLPFRDCYRVLGAATAACEGAGRLDRVTVNDSLMALGGGMRPLSEEEFRLLNDPLKLLAQRGQTGSPNPDMLAVSLEQLRSEAEAAAGQIRLRAAGWRVALEALWKHAEGVASSA